MAEKANAKCAICNTSYTVCNSCLEQKTFKPWRTVTDTMEHYKIYMAIHTYTTTKNKELAQKELSNCDLSGLEGFNPEIKAVIKEIQSIPKQEYVQKAPSVNSKKFVNKNIVKKDIDVESEQDETEE